MNVFAPVLPDWSNRSSKTGISKVKLRSPKMTPNTDVIKNGTANFCTGEAKAKTRNLARYGYR